MQQQIRAGTQAGAPQKGRHDDYGQRWTIDLPLTGSTGTRQRLGDRMDLYDVVEVVNDLPDEKLAAGMVGTIVHVFHEPRLAYEVEFSDTDGQTVAMVPLTPEQIRPVQPEA